MKTTDAKKLKAGDKVYWDQNPDDQGTVTSVDEHTFTVKWSVGEPIQVDFEDADRIHRAQKPPQTPPEGPAGGL